VIGCADSPARQPPDDWPQVIRRLTHVSFIYAPLQGWALWAPCASWPVASANRYTGPWSAVTKVPVLVIGTRFDPNTPFVNARMLEHLLGNAILLTHDGYGHTSSADPSECTSGQSADTSSTCLHRYVERCVDRTVCRSLLSSASPKPAVDFRAANVLVSLMP